MPDHATNLGQIRSLEVQVIGNRVIVKQLALQGVLDVLGGAGATPIEHNVQVMCAPAKCDAEDVESRYGDLR